jgi:alpha-glucoside transport system permease protein
MTKEGAMAVKAKAKSKKRTKPIVPSVMKQGELLPWLFAAPSFLIMVVYVVYPTINTIILSLKNSDGSDWATAACQEGQACWGVLENYRYALTSEAMLTSFRNNLLWMFLMVLGTTALGLVFAVLVDKVKYESLAKALIFMPMAISCVGAGVIWGFMYDFPASEDSPVIGLLNALVLGVGGKPIPWLIRAPWINNIALIFVGIWMWTGFCMTILSAAIKGVPGEILEAARVDGANEFQVFAQNIRYRLCDDRWQLWHGCHRQADDPGNVRQSGKRACFRYRRCPDSPDRPGDDL